MSVFDRFGPNRFACMVLGSFGEVAVSTCWSDSICKKLECHACSSFLSVFGAPGYQKRLSHVPLVLGTIILVPFRPQEARFMHISWVFIIFASTFWSKKVTHNHPNQSPTSRLGNRGPPQDSIQPSQSTEIGHFFHFTSPGPFNKNVNDGLVEKKTRLVDRGAP